MELFSFLRNLGSKKSVSNTFGGEWLPIGGVDDGVNERNLLLNNKEWVFIAVDKVASSVASIRFKVMRYKRNGDDTEVFDGPLVDFLENPSPSFTGKDFIYLNTVYKELTGNAFWERTTGRKVLPLIPTNVSPVENNGKLTGYRYTSGATQRIIPYKDVLHDRYVDPARPYWGRGKLSRIARWVDTSQYSNEFLRRFFLNGATFGGFIETEEESEERIKLIKAGLANDHVGVENAHKTGVLPKGAKYQKVTANMGEIEMGATDDRYRDKILSGFGVPKTLVGLTTEVNRASAEAAEYVFSRYTVKPIADDFVEFLNLNVAPMLGGGEEYYYAYEDFIPANMDVELREREIALNRQPYKTVNEVRAETGLPPVKGGDIIYGNPFQVPLGQPTPSPDPAPGGDDDDEDDTPPPTKHARKAVPSHVRKADARNKRIDRITGGIAEKLIELASNQGLADEASHRDFVGRVDPYRERIEKAVRDFNNRQKREVELNLNRITKSVTKTDLFDMTAEMEIMVNFVSPLLGGLLTEQALAEYQAQGFAGTFDSGSEMIKKTVERAAKRLAKSYNNTTANLLKSALNDGINAGDSLSQLTKRVQDIYEYNDIVRAKAVAHTESFYIANKGNREAYRQSGVVKSVRYYTALDERVCEFCGPENGKIIGVNDKFYAKGDVIQGTNGGMLRLDYRSIDVPPIHTNCRCFVRPEEISIE